MLDFRPLKAQHIKYIRNIQITQKDEEWAALSEQYVMLANNGEGFSAWKGNTCLGAGGIVRLYGERAAAWALVSASASPHMVEITRFISKMLDRIGPKRIEAYVSCDFPNGLKWAKLLKFTCEADKLRYYGPNGEDQALFSRIKE